MRSEKGGIVVECSLLALVVLSLALFFWGLNSNITHFQELDMLIYQSIVDVKDEIYLYSKLKEYIDFNQRQDEILKKIQNALPMDLDEEKIKNAMGSRALNLLILNKIKGRWEETSDIDLRDAFHLKEYPLIKTSIKSGNLVVEAYLKFEFVNISDWFKTYESCIRYEIGCRNIEKILFEGDASSKERIMVFITQNGLDKTRVFHRNIRCFGLRTAERIESISAGENDETINYKGENLHLCLFCRMGMLYDLRD